MNDHQKAVALDAIYDWVKSHLAGRENSAGFYRCECPFGHEHQDRNQASYNIGKGYFQCLGNADHNRHFGQMLEVIGLSPDKLPTYYARPLPEPIRHRPQVLWDDHWHTNLNELDACAGLRAWLVGQGIHAYCHPNMGYTGNDSRLPDYAKQKLAMAWRDMNYRVVGVKLRTLPHQKKFYCSIEGSDYTGHLYNYHNPNHELDIVIQETERDCSALCEWTGRPYLGIAAPTGHWTGSLKRYYAGLLAPFHNVYVARDRGEAGEKMMAAIWEICRRAIELLPTEGNKDLGECFQTNRLPDWLYDFRQAYPHFNLWEAT